MEGPAASGKPVLQDAGQGLTREKLLEIEYRPAELVEMAKPGKTKP